MTCTNTSMLDLLRVLRPGRPVTMTGRQIFGAKGGDIAGPSHRELAKIWRQEDNPGMPYQLGLEPPPAIIRRRRPIPYT